MSKYLGHKIGSTYVGYSPKLSFGCPFESTFSALPMDRTPKVLIIFVVVCKIC